MSTRGSNPRIAYFDSIAGLWDQWHDRQTEQHKLLTGLAELHVGPGEAVADVGCGTGNLTGALLQRLSPAGRVIAVDASPRMVETARGQIDDPRVRWLLASVEQLPLEDQCVDRAICYSVWPHVADPAAAARELYRIVRPGGSMHVWHLASRDRINEIHAGAGEAVRRDLLLPASEVARCLEQQHWRVDAIIDDASRYLVSAHRDASP